MKKLFFKITLLVSAVSCFSFLVIKQSDSFKTVQLKNARVKKAYTNKWEDLKKQLDEKKIDSQKFNIYLRAFKFEKEFEIWVKNTSDTKYQLLKTIPICASSGELGPKQKEGDGQVPEGFYEINAFNPNSNYNLALKVSYPNAADKIRNIGNRLGGDIMVHGDCVTIGCIPLQNDPITEVYILCVEAQNRKLSICIDIYPCKFTTQNTAMLANNYGKSLLNFWDSLKESYLFFEKNNYQPRIKITKKGEYTVEKY